MIYNILPVEIAYTISIISYSVLLISLFMGFHIYLKRWLTGNKGNKILITYAIMFLLLMIGRIIFIIFDYYLTNFDNSVFNDYLTIWKAGMAFVLLGFGVFLYIMTQQVIRNKPKIRIAILLVYCIPILFMIFMDTIESAQLFSIISLVTWVLIPIGYGYIASQTTGDLRNKAIIVIIGVLVFVLAYALIAEEAMLLLINSGLSRFEVHALSAIGKTIGIIFIIRSY